MTDSRPSGMLRLLLRAPILLYRLGIGRLLGHRFLLLAHRGRTTGRRRETVLEVVQFDAAAPQAVVAAAWGARSDWLRNISASPPLELRIGGERWPHPHHRVLGADDAASALGDYARRHPRAWRALAPRLGLGGEVSAATVASAVERFPVVAFSPATGAPAPRA